MGDVILSEMQTSPELGEIDCNKRDMEIVVKKHKLNFKLQIFMGTSLKLVGCQIWKASFLMAEFILRNKRKFKNKIILELGSGTGMVGLFLFFCKAENIFLTDYDPLILMNCQFNLYKNFSKILISQKVFFRELNLLDFSLEVYKRKEKNNENKFNFERDEMTSLLDNVDYILASDLIYDENITLGLIKFISCFLNKCSKTLIVYLALEKRTNFVLENLKPSAKNYDFLIDRLLEFGLYYKNIDIESIPNLLDYSRTKDLIFLEIKNI